MEIKYNKTGKDRKALVDAISDIIGEPAIYLATPTFAYKIGDWYTVTKDGNLDIFDRADSEEVENLIEQLDKLGFTAEPQDEIELVILGVDEGSDEPEGFSIGMPISELSDKPFSEDTLCRFNDIVSSKCELFQKALGTTSKLITEREDNTLWFDWFDRMIDTEHLEIYSTFIKALYRFAENAKRVNISQNEVENEKFTMRTFLNRIGLSGTEHKLLRKELMKNLSGNSAFRYGGPKDSTAADTITTICYGKVKKWNSRQEACDSFLEAMNGSDGSERERYTTIYTKLMAGMTICSDEDE